MTFPLCHEIECHYCGAKLLPDPHFRFIDYQSTKDELRQYCRCDNCGVRYHINEQGPVPLKREEQPDMPRITPSQRAVIVTATSLGFSLRNITDEAGLTYRDWSNCLHNIAAAEKLEKLVSAAQRLAAQHPDGKPGPKKPGPKKTETAPSATPIVEQEAQIKAVVQSIEEAVQKLGDAPETDLWVYGRELEAIGFQVAAIRRALDPREFSLLTELVMHRTGTSLAIHSVQTIPAGATDPEALHL